MKPVICFLFAMTMLYPGIVMSSTWQDYLSAQDGEVDWANTVRGAARGNTGLAVLKGSKDETFDYQPLLQSLANVTNTKDLILPVGGLGSGRRKDLVDNYMRMIRFDKGERWRRLVSEQATAVAAQFPKRHVYWQIGNEINSWHFVESMSPWTDSEEIVARDPIADIRLMERDSAEERDQRRQERKQSKGKLKKLKRNNETVVPLYVEYFLAPSAQAIIDARKQNPEYAGRIKIVLGTIANSHNRHAQSWLKNLLNYRIRGDYAAQLAGRKVSEIVDIIGLNYIVSGPGPAWHDNLKGLYGEWLGHGSIRGIWSAEEIGRKRALSGLGGATAVTVLARYMVLWNELGLDPQQGRVNFWGAKLGDSGTRAGEAMQTVLRLVGDTQLIPVPEGEITLQSKGDHASYFFKTTQGKLVLVQDAANKGLRFEFNGFQIKWEGKRKPRVKVIVLGKQGQNELEPEIKLENGLLTVSTPDELSTGDVILVVVDSA